MNFINNIKLIVKLKFVLFILPFLLIGCVDNSKSISFSVLDSNNKIIEIAKVANEKIIKDYFHSPQESNFRKLILLQSNGDNLIVEQKDEKGYLILVKIRYEQFLIETQPTSKNEVMEIMFRYLKIKDKIMKETKFY